MTDSVSYNSYLRKTVDQASQTFTALKYSVSGRVATITLSRPERYNAINDTMPYEIQRAVFLANTDGASENVSKMDFVHLSIVQSAIWNLIG
jgi:1,4-dihydroxy-2-naphthoyl-CoA synthase